MLNKKLNSSSNKSLPLGVKEVTNIFGSSHEYASTSKK